jgi:hypothetical protein
MALGYVEWYAMKRREMIKTATVIPSQIPTVVVTNRLHTERPTQAVETEV